MYATENGHVIYTTQAAPTLTVPTLQPSSVSGQQLLSQSPAQPQQQLQQPHHQQQQQVMAALPTTPVPPTDASVVASVAGTAPTTTPAGASTTPKRGKKRKHNNKENAILAESVDDLPCAPDDEDLNTPYSCEQCNKTIKGRVMLQAHQYQEHYENPEMAGMDLGDKHACRVCLKLFTRNSDVKAHILRVHCGDRRYPCTMCGKRFKESTHLRKHLYTHTGRATLHQANVCLCRL